MENQTKLGPSTGDRRALLVVVFGILVATIPFVLVPPSSPGDPVAFAVLLVQVIVAVVGLGVAATGVYSYRTGDLRPAIAATTTIVGLVIVGAVGGLVEMAGGPLVPIWVWLLATVTVVIISLTVTYRVAPA